MKKFLATLFSFCFVLLSFAGINQAKFVKINLAEAYSEENKVNSELSFAANAKSAILLEANTNQIIFSKNEQERLPIASMTKMMSLAVIFDAIKSGKLDLSSKTQISNAAASTGGSQAFLDENKSYVVEDLIKTVIIASANDSTVALSEAVSGSEREFVKLMNEKAQNLGLKNTHFSNSTGLPAPEHYSSAQDCAIIYKEIMNNEIYNKYAKVWMEDFVHPGGRTTQLVNTNRLVKTMPGCEAGKTGFTKDAGYCLTCSCLRNDVRFIAVVIGEPDSKTRFSEVQEMLNYGFSNYASTLVLDKNKVNFSVEVKNGVKPNFSAHALENLYAFSKKGETPKTELVVETFNLKAPLKVGQVVGEVKVVNTNGEIIAKTSLVLSEDAAKETLLSNLHKIAVNW